MGGTGKTCFSYCSQLLMTENSIVQVYSALCCQISRLEEENGELGRKPESFHCPFSCGLRCMMASMSENHTTILLIPCVRLKRVSSQRSEKKYYISILVSFICLITYLWDVLKLPFESKDVLISKFCGLIIPQYFHDWLTKPTPL